MTLGVFQGHSSIASFFLYLQARRAVPLPLQSFLSTIIDGFEAYLYAKILQMNWMNLL